MDKILPLVDYGHKDFGENKVQEAYEKWFDIKEKNKCLRKWIDKFKKLPGLQLKMIKKSANELAFGQAKSIMHMEVDQFLLSRNN